MQNTLILYASKYGATKRYAQLLQQELSGTCMKIAQASAGQLGQYDTIIFGGSLYVGKMQGIKLFQELYPHMKGKRVVVFAVGAMRANSEAEATIQKSNFTPEMANVPLIYCRGNWNEAVLSKKDKVLVWMMRKIAKNDPQMQATVEQDLGQTQDWVSKKAIAPIITAVGQ